METHSEYHAIGNSKDVGIGFKVKVMSKCKGKEWNAFANFYFEIILE